MGLPNDGPESRIGASGPHPWCCKGSLHTGMIEGGCVITMPARFPWPPATGNASDAALLGLSMRGQHEILLMRPTHPSVKTLGEVLRVRAKARRDLSGHPAERTSRLRAEPPCRTSQLRFPITSRLKGLAR